MHCITGIPVAEMEMDGQYTIDSYLNHTEGIGQSNLTDFTICLRFNVNYLKPSYSSMLSYSTYLSDDALEIGLMQRSAEIIFIYYCKYRRFGQVIIFHFSGIIINYELTH